MFLANVFDGDFFIPIMIFAIPIVAIVGGITAGIVRTIGQQRLAELAQRERIAAIERGVDPSKLPPAPSPMLDTDTWYAMTGQSQHRRAQGLMIAGIITLAAGISLAVFLRMVVNVEDSDRNVWAVGLIPATVGVALLLCAWLVRPNEPGSGTGTPPRSS